MSTPENEQIKALDKQIKALKKELAVIGDMRPGTLSIQYQDAKHKRRPYHQLSYTHKRKSRTEYIREPFVPIIQNEVQQYARFRDIIDQWVELAIQKSKINLQRIRNATPKKPTRTKTKKK